MPTVKRVPKNKILTKEDEAHKIERKPPYKAAQELIRLRKVCLREALLEVYGPAFGSDKD